MGRSIRGMGQWDYYDCGPSEWGLLFDDFCNSSWKTQSSLDIETISVTTHLHSPVYTFN